MTKKDTIEKNNIDTNSIFITHDSSDTIKNISYTSILKTIPDNYQKTPLLNWSQQYKTEWRWRFLKFNKMVVEISYQKANSNQRIYYNKHGNWVERDIDKIYDQYVDDEYYCYTN